MPVGMRIELGLLLCVAAALASSPAVARPGACDIKAPEKIAAVMLMVDKARALTAMLA